MRTLVMQDRVGAGGRRGRCVGARGGGPPPGCGGGWAVEVLLFGGEGAWAPPVR